MRSSDELIAAITRGDAGGVAALANAGVDLGARTPTGIAPLVIAIRTGNADVVRTLLQAGANVQAGPEQRTLLMEAAWAGCATVVQALLQSGHDVNARDSDGMTALMYAADGGSVDVVKVLLEAGADVSATNSSGQTALTLAQKLRWGFRFRLFGKEREFLIGGPWAGREIKQVLRQKGARSDSERALRGCRGERTSLQRNPETSVLTSRGKPVAAVVAIRPCMDAETFALSHNADFIQIINRSWKGDAENGGFSLDEVRRKYGLKRAVSRRPPRRPR